MHAPSVQHYENFPVASLFMPRRLRAATRVIYWFARSADDIADEGHAPTEERLASLQAYREELHRIERGEPAQTELFLNVGTVIAQHQLPVSAFHDLLDAFMQDVSKTRYADFSEVMSYCKKSANPVGRLMLALYGDHDARHQAYSDAICSALQLLNFLQDIAVDYDKQRIYLPQTDLARYHISEAQIARHDASGTWSPFMLAQIERVRRLLQAGAPLGVALKGRIGLEMRLIISGADIALGKLHKARGDVFNQSVRLTVRDWPIILYRAVRKK